MTLRILYVVGDLDLGGAERHLVAVLPELRRRGFRPLVFTLTHKGRLAPVLERSGVEVIEPPFAGLRRRLPARVRRAALLPWTTAALLWCMYRRRPEVVHFFLPAAYLVGGLCSVLAGIRSRVMSRRSLNDYQSGYPLTRPIEKWLHPRMSAVLANSQAVLDQLRAENVPEERLGVIYNGIDVVAFERVESRHRVRKKLGLSGRTVVLVAVANLIPYKGHRDLLEALAARRAELPPEWVLLCIGKDTGIGKELKSYASALGLSDRVYWLGEREDVAQLLNASDIGVLCSHQEGFSNSLLEYMAASLPVVATDVGGNAEAVVDGVTGRLVPARGPAALGEALAELANAPEKRRRMGSAGRARVIERFSLERCVEQYAFLYDALAAGVKSVSEIFTADKISREEAPTTPSPIPTPAAREEIFQRRGGIER